MPTSSAVSQGDLAVADHINNVRTDVLSTHTHDGTEGNATIEATSFTGTATYTGASLTFGDEDLLRWGTNADVVSMLRSTALSADTELTGIIEGTSDHPGVAANSLIISNITDDGDIMFVVSDGGNSKGLLKLDGANGKVTIHGGDLEVAEALTVTGATTLNGNVTLGDSASDVITVNGTLAGANALIFEGATADGYETTLAYTDPTADRTITFPNLSGTVVLGGVDNGALAITTTGLITGGSLDIDDVLINGTTIGHTDDTDLMTVADGVLTIAGELDATTLDISGNADIAGDLTLSAGTDGALRFSAASSIKILDNSGTALVIEEADNAYMTFVTTDSSEAVTIAKTLTLSTVAAAGTDTDKFLVLDSSGNVDYRTGSQVLSDIGAGTGSGSMTSFQLEDDDGTEVTISDAKEVKIIGSGVTTNWTDTDNGTDGDPYDLTITVDAAQTGITSILATDVKIGEDDQTKIDFETADEIHFYVANAHEVTLAANELSPNTSDGIALGTSSKMWSDLFLASGAVINFNNGDVTLTHSSNDLAVGGGSLTSDGGVKIDNITIDGTEIDLSSGDLTIDVAGDIILDADGDDLVFAAAGTNLLKITNSSSDVVFQPQVDAKDIKFNQYDGNLLLDINDGGWVGVHNAAAGPGQLRFYEDTDNGTNYTAFQVGTQSGDVTYTLPTADGSDGTALTTNGSGTLSWAAGGVSENDVIIMTEIMMYS